MGKKKGIIISDLCVYLLTGTILIFVSINTFKIIYLGYRNFIEINDVKSDFINVSQRIKFDLLKDVDFIEVKSDSIHFRFKDFSQSTGENFDIKNYTLKMDKGRLSYVVDGLRVVGMDLSDLIRSIECRVKGNILKINFKYDNYSFERSFRLDSVKEKRVYNHVMYNTKLLPNHGIFCP